MIGAKRSVDPVVAGGMAPAARAEHPRQGGGDRRGRSQGGLSLKRGPKARGGDGWLVFKRKAGQTFRIGNVVFRVRWCRDGEVSLAMHAPLEHRFVRGEVSGADDDGLMSRLLGDRAAGRD